MFDNLLKTLHSVTEAAVGNKTLDSVKLIAIRQLIQEKLNGHGEIVDVQFDSKTKRLALELRLKGEETNLHLVIEEYEIEEIDGRVNFVVKRVTASKAWIDGLIPTFLPFRVPVPDKYAQAVKILL